MIREQRVSEMLSCFESIPVRPGDCFVVPAGTPHAIGAGIFMMELQEPTDWVVRCETSTTDGEPLPPEACFMGLDLDTCLDVFNYEEVSVEQVRRRWQQQPRVWRDEPGFCAEEIIAPEYHNFFRLDRLRGEGSAGWPGNELTLLIGLKGGGSLAADGGSARVIAAGETWLLPGCVREWQWTNAGGDWEILLAKPPVAQDTAANHAA
jgi:mannose-6-phosphate isomerase